MAGTDDSQAKAAVLRALGHPTRLRILEALEREPASPVDFISMGAHESLGTVSHHFRALRNAGLIEVGSTEQRRGAIKNTYRLTTRGRKTSAWAKQLPSA